MTYLNLRMSYYYFRFRKVDGHHIGILLPLSILTYPSSLANHFASVYQISSKSVNSRQSYDVVSIFQDEGQVVGNILPVAGLVTELV